MSKVRKRSLYFIYKKGLAAALSAVLIIPTACSAGDDLIFTAGTNPAGEESPASRTSREETPVGYVYVCGAVNHLIEEDMRICEAIHGITGLNVLKGEGYGKECFGS